jgi:hypothetical protein
VSTLDDIRTTLASAVSVGGVQGYARVPGQINTPAAVVAPDSIAYSTDFDGGATYTVPVQFLVSLGDWASAQAQLDGIIAHDGSAVEAIHEVTDFEVRVTGMQDYGLTTYAGTDYLGASLLVEVIV